MNQTKINIHLKSSNLQQSILAVKELVEREFTDEKWDVTVDIDVKGFRPMPSKPKSTRIYTSHDWDTACDANNCVPDPSLRAPWED